MLAAAALVGWCQRLLSLGPLRSSVRRMLRLTALISISHSQHHSCEDKRMFEMDCMPDLLKPCGIVFPMQQQMNNTESDQLIQEMLIDAKHCEIYEQSSSNFITLDAVTPITPPFTIHTVVTHDDGGATSKCSSSEKYEKASTYFNEQTGII